MIRIKLCELTTLNPKSYKHEVIIFCFFTRNDRFILRLEKECG